MRGFLKFIPLILIMILCLFSCEGGENIPQGLSKIEIREGEDFIIYCPEGWSDISAPMNEKEYVYAAKMSTVKKTSMTFVETDMPEGELGDYLAASLDALPEKIEPTILTPLTKCTFGNAEEAYKCVYTYKYDDYDYTAKDYVAKDFSFLQIFVKHGERFFIFTYTAEGLASDENSDYSIYLENIQLVIDNFKISGEGAPSVSVPNYEKDADGYNLVSDEGLCGFKLYLPDSYTVIDSRGDVEAKIPGGATISLTTATQTGASIKDYWKLRKLELERFATNVTEIEVNRANREGEEPVVIFGNLDTYKVASYEYTYDFGGVSYHVYQVMGVDNLKGYVFTYTAPESEYAANLDTIEIILKKVRF